MTKANLTSITSLRMQTLLSYWNIKATTIEITKVGSIRPQLHEAIYHPDSFVLTLRYCMNLKAIRYKSMSFNRITADKLHHVIAANNNSTFSLWYNLSKLGLPPYKVYVPLMSPPINALSPTLVPPPMCKQLRENPALDLLLISHVMKLPSPFTTYRTVNWQKPSSENLTKELMN